MILAPTATNPQDPIPPFPTRRDDVAAGGLSLVQSVVTALLGLYLRWVFARLDRLRADWLAGTLPPPPAPRARPHAPGRRRPRRQNWFAALCEQVEWPQGVPMPEMSFSWTPVQQAEVAPPAIRARRLRPLRGRPLSCPIPKKWRLRSPRAWESSG